MRVIRTLRALGHPRGRASTPTPTRGAPHVRAADAAVRGRLVPRRRRRSSRRRGARAPTRSTPATASCRENAAFARACADGGPGVRRPAAGGDRADGRQGARRRRPPRAAGVPVVPSSSVTRSTEVARSRRARLPAAGQGRRGRRRQGHARRARAPDELDERARRRAARGAGRRSATTACSSSATSSAPRHIEVQVLADAHGTVRAPRRARVLAAAPPPEGRRGGAVAGRRRTRCARAWARRRSRSRAPCGYDGAGTVEFIADADDPRRSSSSR